MEQILNMGAFMDALVADTLDDKITWYYLDPPESIETIPEFLFTCEFRQIDFRRSYYCATNIGLLFLIYSINRPGDDEALDWDGYELHLQPEAVDPARQYYKLMEKSEQLYRLENAVRSRIADTIKFMYRDAAYYLKLYLQRRENSV